MCPCALGGRVKRERQGVQGQHSSKGRTEKATSDQKTAAKINSVRNISSVLNGTSSSDPSLKGSGMYAEEKVKRLEEPRKRCLPDTTGMMYIQIHRDWDRTHRICTGSNRTKSSAIDTHRERESMFSPTKSYWVSATLQGRPHAQEQLANTKQTPWFYFLFS